MNNNNETPCGLPQPTPVRLIEPVKISTNWQQVRIQAAIYAMQTIADALGSVDYNKELIAKHAVELADALIEELKKGEHYGM